MTRSLTWTKNSGSVLVEAVLSFFVILTLSAGLALVIVHVWARAFIQVESFYLARARLYANTTRCDSGKELLSEKWIARTYTCSHSTAQVTYKLLPRVFPSNTFESSLASNLQGK